MKILSALSLLACLLSFKVSAADNSPPAPGAHPMPPHRHEPPREALDACNGKSAGSPAQMTAPDGRVVRGTCRLLLVPEKPQGAPEPRPNPPPNPPQ